MARPVKWSRELHLLRDTARHSRTETWSRQEIEQLFDVGRASAQSLMKAIGEVQTVGAAHFVDRHCLLSFLDDMISANSVEQTLRSKLAGAAPPPRRKLLRITLPEDLRHAMLPDLPANVCLSPGRIEITGASTTTMVEALISLAMVMQNDLARWEQAISVPTPVIEVVDEELRMLFKSLRNRPTTHNDARPT